MRKLTLAVYCFFIAMPLGSTFGEGIILDTDMSGDCDDAGALAVLHCLADFGECEVLAVVTNRKDATDASAAAVAAINTWYGRGRIPIGTDKDGCGENPPRRSPYTEALRDHFPGNATRDSERPDALEIYRETLIKAKDHSVTICSIGALSNLATLLREERALVKSKVRRLVVMGGNFTGSNRQPETNIRLDIPAAQTVCRHWPTEMIWSGFAVGQKVIAGGGLVDTTTRNPVRRAYQLRMFDGRPSLRGGKPAFDQTAVLIAVRGVEDRYWRASPPGRVEVDDAGRTSWTAEEDGPHRFVNFRYRPAGVTALIDRMMAKPPLLKSQRPVPVIFDTDMGADIDDALALAVLHGLQSRGEVDMLAITSSKDHPASATVIDMINTWYGRGDIPIGRVVDGFQQDDGKYLIPTASAKTADGQPLFPHDLTPESAAPEAVSLIRKTLANADDDSAVLILVGQQTNVARLLQSAPDQHSNLSGMDLVKQKVRCLSVMAGAFNRPDQGPVRFDGKPEWNIRVDVESAKTVFEKWPVEIVVAPWELGRRLMYPGVSIERDFDRPNRPPHPVAHAYRHWDRMPYDRPSFDLISVLHAARPNRGYFNETEWGRVVLDEKGYTTFKPDPGGKMRVLACTDAQAARTIEAFVGLASEAP